MTDAPPDASLPAVPSPLGPGARARAAQPIAALRRPSFPHSLTRHRPFVAVPGSGSASPTPRSPIDFLADASLSFSRTSLSSAGSAPFPPTPPAPVRPFLDAASAFHTNPAVPDKARQIKIPAPPAYIHAHADAPAPSPLDRLDYLCPLAPSPPIGVPSAHLLELAPRAPSSAHRPLASPFVNLDPRPRAGRRDSAGAGAGERRPSALAHELGALTLHDGEQRAGEAASRS
ncbi:hypothetical protein Q5752_001540 [Cryptotrichosporon argae]